MVFINYGCEDFLPVGLPQSGDVGFKSASENPMLLIMPLRTSLKYLLPPLGLLLFVSYIRTCFRVALFAFRIGAGPKSLRRIFRNDLLVPVEHDLHRMASFFRGYLGGAGSFVPVRNEGIA